MKRSSLQAASLSLFDLLVTAKAARGLVCTRTRAHKISRDVHDEARNVARRNVKTIRQVVNIPAASGQLRYAHCSYTDTSVRQCVSAEPVSAGTLEALGLTVATMDWQPGTREAALNGTNGGVPVGLDAMTFPVPSRQGERAVFGMTAASNGIDCNADAQILVSARELDCLKWTAAGKIAWEVSVIQRANRQVPPQCGAREARLRDHDTSRGQGHHPASDQHIKLR